MRGRRTLIDRQHGGWMETKSRDLLTSFSRQVVTLVGLAARFLRCVFSRRSLLKSFLDDCWYRSVAGSENQFQLCRHPEGFKSSRFFIAPLKMGCWVQLMTEFQCIFSSPGNFLLDFAFELG